MYTIENNEIDDDLFSPSAINDPYAYFGRIRELDPVHWNERHQLWIITRHDDVAWVNRRPDLFSSAMQDDPRPPYPPIEPEDEPAYEFVKENVRGRITRTDPPAHRDQRAALQPFFTTAASERWRSVIVTALESLLDGLDGRREMDVMADLAVPLPLRVISELMAIPEPDRPWVRKIAERLLIGPRVGDNRMADLADAMKSIVEYIAPLAEDRLARPGEDLISLLMAGEAAGAFTRAQVLQDMTLFIVAGHETTINLICNGLLAFINFPDQWDRLRADPVGLAGTATEECLRYDPPVKSVERLAVADVELRGKLIKQYDRVRWFISSANRDPERFDSPDTFDIGRVPNAHLGFGHGIHLCLGATLARIEGQEVFRALAERFERFILITDPLEYTPAADLRSLKSLQVSW